MLPILLGIFFGLFLLCGGALAGAWFGLVQPWLKEKENQARQILEPTNTNPTPTTTTTTTTNTLPTTPTAREVLPVPPRAPLLISETLAKFTTATTLTEIDTQLESKGRLATEEEVRSINAKSSEPFPEPELWLKRQKQGLVMAWEERQHQMMAAFTKDPKSGGKVMGLIATLKGKTTEPISLEDNSDLTYTSADLRRKFEKLKGRVLKYQGHYYQGIQGGDGLNFEMVNEQMLRTAIMLGDKKPDWKEPPLPADVVLATGKLIGNPNFVLLEKAEVVSVTKYTGTPVAVKSEDLCREYFKDPKAAAEKYDGKLVSVTGTVQGGTSWGGKIDLWGITERVNGKLTSYGTTFTFFGAHQKGAIVTNFSEKKTFTIIGRCKGLKAGGTVPTVEFEHCWVPK